MIKRALSSAPLLLACASLSWLGLQPPAAHAGETKSFVLDGEKELSEGKLEGVAVESIGQVVTGVGTRRLSIPEATVARALLTEKDGTSYIGTATKGTVYRLKNNVLSVYAETGAMMATSLASNGKGALFVGTSPGGKVLRVSAANKVETFCELKNSEHVWALVYDEKRNTLFAATGPEGIIYSIDGRGKAEVFFDSTAEHIMTLALEAGTLYAGTSDEAVVLAIDAPGKARVVYDFDANEVTALAVHDGVVAAAANTFPKKSVKSAAKPSSKSKGESNGGASKTPPSPPASTKTRGQLFRIDRQGSARLLHEASDGHISAVAFDREGNVLAATSKAGEVTRFHADGTHALWLDADEKEVLAIDARNAPARFTTGDGAAVYTLEEGPSQKGSWTSAALDARFEARFGQLDFRGRGALSLSTRSGNTEKPDDTWSAWSAPIEKPGPIRSPAARFLQVRATLGANAVLYAATAYYLPRNQAAIVRTVEGEPRSNDKGKEKGPVAPTTIYRLKWSVDNPDGDRLRYRLAYRPESAQTLRPMFREYVTWTQETLDWNTEAIPDGYYLVQVEASDELDNPAPYVQRSEAYSEPILVDNHPPDIEGLNIRGRTVVGSARDSLGPISTLHYKIDNELWEPLAPKDGLLDTALESFELPLPAELERGPHLISIRASDARNNSVTAALEFEVRDARQE